MNLKFLLPALLILAGCGGGGSNAGQGDISGIVFDQAGNPVRGARVFAGGKQTFSTTSGSYILQNVSAVDLTVHAEVRDAANGHFIGQNVARVFQNDRAKSVNIAVYPDAQIRGFSGTVRDRNGNRVSGARVFARQHTANTVLSSSSAITANDGTYVLDGLLNGLTYDVVCNAQGLGEQSDTLVAGDGSGTADFVLGSATNPAMPTPTGFSAVAWTSPREETRSVNYQHALAAIKQRVSKRPVQKTVRDTVNGNPIEVDLTWDPYTVAETLGFGVYRGTTSNNLQAVDFFRDAQAQLYSDADAGLIEQQTYFYAVSGLNTLFDANTGNGESLKSPVQAVTPLGDLFLSNPSGQTIQWQPAVGATNYAVFVYDNYPAIGEQSRYDNFQNPVSGTSFTVPISLQSGKTYYYLVLGSNNDDSAKTVSPVGTFVAP